MLDLDALTDEKKLPRVKLAGREHPVRPLSTASAHRIATVQSVADNGEAMLAALLDVVARCIPTLTREEVEALSVEQVAAVVQLSRGQIAEVEAQLTERAEKN